MTQLLTETFGLRLEEAKIVKLENNRRRVERAKAQHCNKENKNKRRYRTEKTYGPHLQEGSPFINKIKSRQVFGHVEHPEDGRSDLNKAAILIESAWMEGDEVFINFETLSTTCGKTIQSLIDDKLNFGLSSRATGSILRAEDGVDEVQEDFVPETWDCVADPSVGDARVTEEVKRRLTEAYNATTEESAKQRLDEEVKKAKDESDEGVNATIVDMPDIIVTPPVVEDKEEKKSFMERRNKRKGLQEFFVNDKGTYKDAWVASGMADIETGNRADLKWLAADGNDVGILKSAATSLQRMAKQLHAVLKKKKMERDRIDPDFAERIDNIAGEIDWLDPDEMDWDEFTSGITEHWQSMVDAWWAWLEHGEISESKKSDGTSRSKINEGETPTYTIGAWQSEQDAEQYAKKVIQKMPRSKDMFGDKIETSPTSYSLHYDEEYNNWEIQFIWKRGDDPDSINDFIHFIDSVLVHHKSRGYSESYRTSAGTSRVEEDTDTEVVTEAPRKGQRHLVPTFPPELEFIEDEYPIDVWDNEVWWDKQKGEVSIDFTDQDTATAIEYAINKKHPNLHTKVRSVPSQKIYRMRIWGGKYWMESKESKVKKTTEATLERDIILYNVGKRDFRAFDVDGIDELARELEELTMQDLYAFIDAANNDTFIGVHKTGVEKLKAAFKAAGGNLLASVSPDRAKKIIEGVNSKKDIDYLSVAKEQYDMYSAADGEMAKLSTTMHGPASGKFEIAAGMRPDLAKEAARSKKEAMKAYKRIPSENRGTEPWEVYLQNALKYQPESVQGKKTTSLKEYFVRSGETVGTMFDTLFDQITSGEESRYLKSLAKEDPDAEWNAPEVKQRLRGLERKAKEVKNKLRPYWRMKVTDEDAVSSIDDLSSQLETTDAYDDPDSWEYNAEDIETNLDEFLNIILGLSESVQGKKTTSLKEGFNSEQARKAVDTINSFFNDELVSVRDAMAGPLTVSGTKQEIEKLSNLLADQGFEVTVSRGSGSYWLTVDGISRFGSGRVTWESVQGKKTTSDVLDEATQTTTPRIGESDVSNDYYVMMFDPMEAGWILANEFKRELHALVRKLPVDVARSESSNYGYVLAADKKSMDKFREWMRDNDLEETRVEHVRKHSRKRTSDVLDEATQELINRLVERNKELQTAVNESQEKIKVLAEVNQTMDDLQRLDALALEQDRLVSKFPALKATTHLLNKAETLDELKRVARELVHLTNVVNKEQTKITDAKKKEKVDESATSGIMESLNGKTAKVTSTAEDFTEEFSSPTALLTQHYRTKR